MVFKPLNVGPNGQASVKGVNYYPVSMQLGAQGAGEQADGVDKQNPGRSFRKKSGVGDQSRIEKLVKREGAPHDIHTAMK